jgi:hypothetical protein
MRWLVVAIAILSSGCSFAPVPYVQGTLTRIDAPSEASTGMPIHLRAHATFAQHYEHPTLNVHVPLDGATAVSLEAVADWQAPPMGLGILARLPFTTDVDLDGSVTFDRPGSYVLTGEGLAPVTVVVGP